jgi:hypothetical protein
VVDLEKHCTVIYRDKIFRRWTLIAGCGLIGFEKTPCPNSQIWSARISKTSPGYFDTLRKSIKGQSELGNADTDALLHLQDEY